MNTYTKTSSGLRMATMRNSQHPLINETDVNHQTAGGTTKNSHFTNQRRSKNVTNSSSIGKSLASEDYGAILQNKSGVAPMKTQNSSKLIKPSESKLSGGPLSDHTNSHKR